MNTAPLTWQILLKPVTFPPSTDTKGPPPIGILEARDELIAANFGLAPTAVAEQPAWAALGYLDAPISVLMLESRLAGRTIGGYATGQDLAPAVSPMVREFSRFLWRSLAGPLRDLLGRYPEELIPWAAEQKFQVELWETGLTDQGREELLNLLQQHFPKQCSPESLKLVTV